MSTCTGVFTQRTTKDGTKTRPERFVPFSGRVYDALKTVAPRIDTPILFPAPRGGHIDLEKFRFRAWAPALRAAGIEYRPPKDLRSTFISWHLSRGTPIATVAEWAGNSIQMIEETYRRYIRSEDEYASRIDNYDVATAAELGTR
jgi:integrase